MTTVQEIQDTEPRDDDRQTMQYNHPMETVSIIASGYEWICPACENQNHEIGIDEIVTCEECQNTYETEAAEHAYN